MFWRKCFQWSSIANFQPFEPDTFALPAPLPNWPPGQGFALERINLGVIEVVKVSRFEYIWGCNLSQDEKKGVSYYKPVGIPDGFFSLGHYCQSNEKPLRGFVLAAKDVSSEQESADIDCDVNSPALEKPIDYSLVWCSGDGSQDSYEGAGFFWCPQPPEGYKAMGFLVTSNPGKPDLDEVRCVRADLTDECQAYHIILDAYSKFSNNPFQVWSSRPIHRGMTGRGVAVGTFFCSSSQESGKEQSIGCLKNLDPELGGMPNLEQLHALIRHYGPIVFFHPHEVYLPSSVSWFFENGALLYTAETSTSEPINATGDNLPGGGSNDHAFWIDLPGDERRNTLIIGNLESAKLYVHAKPALGGTFTDLAMWVFCPFNGPGTLKLGPLSIGLGKIGQHVGDWEHFTLRICNFSGELWSIYFSQHSGGKWVDAYDLEYIDGNKAIVYSSKSGHASYPHPGTYLQGSSKLGVGIMNGAAWSDFFIDSSTSYEIVAAEYLELTEPCWLQYMREWGPKIVYDSRSKLDKIIQFLPVTVRSPVQSIFSKLPLELSGEEGPTGPKEKNNWVGDERG